MEAGAAEMQTLHAALESVRMYEPDFLKEIGSGELRGLIRDGRTALVAFCMTELGSMGFVLTQSGRVRSVPVPDFTLQDLHTWLHGKKVKGPTDEDDGWLAACYSQRMGRMETLLEKISRDLVWPVLRELDKPVDRLLILPSGGLYLVPFHAVPLPERGGRVIDHFEVVYSPSIKVTLKNRARRPSAGGYRALAVLGPEPTFGEEKLQLYYSDFLETVLRRIEQGQTACPPEKTTRQATFRFLTGADCTKEKMLANTQGCTELHFYGHGNFDQANPLQSTLVLSDGERLTLADLQKQTGDLSSIRLLTLTACESGIAETEELPEEYVSLPGGFMQAGVPCVISTLWEVNEEASVLLLSFFHEYYQCGNNPAEALRKAQKRLRLITYRDLKALPIFAASDAWGVQHLLRGFENVPETELDRKPFEHPYYWAAFSVNGYTRSEDED
jgi:CHAT domain-containing protein